jgi:hypothetical protein
VSKRRLQAVKRAEEAARKITGEGIKNDGGKSRPLYIENPTMRSSSNINIIIFSGRAACLNADLVQKTLDPQRVRNIIP